MDEKMNEVNAEEVKSEETVAEEADTATDIPAEEVQEEAKSSKSEKKKTKKLEAEIAELTRNLADTEAKLAEANDRYTRLFAEYDNYRKRSVKEREGIYADAYIDAVKDILPILDNMERALQYKGAQGGDDNMAKGLEMIMKSFEESLSKMGVSEIKALGEIFDPNLHNAIMHEDDESMGENLVIQTFQKGYVLGEKVIRHAMVKVVN